MNDKYLFTGFHCEIRKIFSWKKSDSLSQNWVIKMPRLIHGRLDVLVSLSWYLYRKLTFFSQIKSHSWVFRFGCGRILKELPLNPLHCINKIYLKLF